MKASDAKEYFRTLAVGFFRGYEVTFAHQSRAAKPEIPLVTIAFGNVKRPNSPNYEIDGGVLKGHYLSRLSVVVDLFTNGKMISDTYGNIAYENTAMDEMLSFVDYVNGVVAVDWCHARNMAILVDSDAQDLTGAVNDNNYEYRARQEMFLYFTQDTNWLVTDDVGYFTDVSISEGS